MNDIVTNRSHGMCLIPLLVALSSASTLLADDEVVDGPADGVPIGRGVFIVPRTIVYQRVFGPNSDAAVASSKLDRVLSQKIAALDLVCNLSRAQKKKLELAGRGDIKHLIDRVEEFTSQIQLAQNDIDKIRSLLLAAEPFKPGMLTWPDGDESIFDRTLKTTLTSEQNSRIAVTRAIERLGGHVATVSRDQDAVLHIFLARTPLTDGGLAMLAALANAQSLELASTPISDAGLVHLAALTNLQSLDLTGTDISDIGLSHLSGLTHLRRLDLFGTKVTGRGMICLKDLTNLKELNLSGTRVADLAGLKPLNHLQWLNLEKTLVTDACLVTLRDLTGLQWLDLSGTRISDAGLAHLKGLSSLKWLNLSNTQVTDAGLAELQRVLPAAHVWKRPAAARE